jgi:hypothetical protein
VIAALIPIWREAQRRKAHARSLRIVLSAKLLTLRPSLGKIIDGGHAQHPAAVFTKQDFREVVRTIEILMRETHILTPEEQDHLSVAFVNLEAAVPLYDTPELTVATARNVLSVVDQAKKVLERKRFLHGKIAFPWKHEKTLD